MSNNWMGPSSRGEGRYATAAVCLKGDVSTPDLETQGARLSKFCSNCGAEVITACPSCNAPIRGFYIPPGVSGVGGIFKSLASFCHDCGKPYPWMIENLAAAKGLADELDNLSSEDREKLKTAIDDVITSGPRAEAGAARIKRIVGRAGTAAGQALWKIIVDIASEAAKKIMLGG